LACVSGGKNETAKAKRDLLDSTKSLGKALKTGLGSDKKVKALELANPHFKNDLAVAPLKLKDAAKENNDNIKQIDNQLDSKHQLRLSLAKIDLKKYKATVSLASWKRSVSGTIFIIIALRELLPARHRQRSIGKGCKS
jgi:hypothetical protein